MLDKGNKWESQKFEVTGRKSEKRSFCVTNFEKRLPFETNNRFSKMYGEKAQQFKSSENQKTECTRNK